MKKVIFTVIIALMAACLYAGDFDSLKFAVLDIDIGVRAVGMAGAFTGMADDASAVYYNPAGLSGLKQVEINGSYDKWLDDAYFAYGYFSVPVGPGAIGGMFTFTDYGTFLERSDSGQQGGEIKPNNIYGGLSYGMPFGEIFAAGLGVKFSLLNIDSYSLADVLFDAGITAKLGDIARIGAVIQNVDTKFDEGYSVKSGIGVNVFNIEGNKMTAEIDVKYSSLSAFGISYYGGVEFVLFKVLALRGGYSLNNGNQVLGGMTGLSLGAGVTLDKLSFDYAFTSKGDLGMTHMAGIKLIYEGSEEKDRKNYQKMTEFLAYQSFKDGEDQFDQGNYKKALDNWMEVKSMMPEYEGIDAAISKARAVINSGGSIEKIQQMFNAGMKAYENFDFEKAVKSWSEVKRVYPTYKDIDIWLGDAKDLMKSKGMSKQSEKYFREGIKFYNDCDYDRAITSWEKGLSKDPTNKKIGQYIDRTRAKRLEIKDGISKARADVANDSTVVDGIKRLRSISSVCPAYQDAADILSTLKGLIASKTRDYYFKGIEKYTEGNLDAAIIYWTNIEALDPKSEYLVKVKRYITDARNKQKAIKGFESKKKK